MLVCVLVRMLVCMLVRMLVRMMVVPAMDGSAAAVTPLCLPS